jgi:hypothetical protein
MISLLSIGGNYCPSCCWSIGLYFGDILKNEVLVSFSLTPPAFSALSTLFIASEFATNAMFAVVFVVSR